VLQQKRPMSQLRSTLMLAFSFVLILGGVSAIVDLTIKAGNPPPVGKPGKVGRSVDFTLKDFAGNLVHLSDYRGRNVVVNMWATWCPPCRAEMPDLVAFYRAHQSKDWTLVAINIQDDAAKAQSYVREQGMFFPVLFDPEGEALDIFTVDGLPSTFVVDRTGVIKFAWTGQMTPALLEQRIAPLLSQ
jgi:peroxiredoxin